MVSIAMYSPQLSVVFVVVVVVVVVVDEGTRNYIVFCVLFETYHWSLITYYRMRCAAYYDT